MTVFVVAHGAWSAGWAWKKMRPLLRAAGHELWTPTYTGLGERAHLASSAIDLDTHIADVTGVLKMEDLHDVVLIAHSYGGMVATGVADKARRRIARVVYIDAFAPQDGQSLFDLVGPDAAENMRGKAMGEGAGWRIPPIPMPPDTAPEDVTWATPRRRSQPIKTFEQKIRIASREPPLPRAYIYAKRSGPGDTFRQFADRAKGDPSWKYYEMDASHNPHITCPQDLMATLTRAMGET